MTRHRFFAGLVLLGVFLLGGVTGVLGAGLQGHRHLRRLLDGTPEEVDTRVTLMMLSRGLSLSDDERRAVRQILEKNAAEHTRLRETIEPALSALRAKEREEIRAVLSPEPRARLDGMIEHLDERRRRLGRMLDH